MFPLQGALLLPQGKLPLNIFEKRYLAMVEDALAGQRLIGMIQPDGNQPDGPTGPAVYGVGCLGRISSFSETEDGRFLIAISGLIRFDLTGEKPLRRGYRRCLPNFTRFLGDLQPRPRRWRSALNCWRRFVCISRRTALTRIGRASKKCRMTSWSSLYAWFARLAWQRNRPCWRLLRPRSGP